MNKLRRLVIWIMVLGTGCLSAHQPAYVVGELMGQLGNQFFIIAATVSLALDHGAIPVFPDLINNTDYNIPINYKNVFNALNTNIPKHLNHIKRYAEPCFNYVPIPYEPNMRIFGYFQSEKYFAHHKQEILDLFAPPAPILNYLSQRYQDILAHPNSVAIHLRSYYREDPKGQYHITYGREYVDKAIAHFPNEALFVIFSNDIPWCKKMLKGFSRKHIFIENEPHYHDFYLMSLCKHNIICNSSFSWWAAYLNRNENKIVVAPDLWFNPSYVASTKDLKPEGWILIR